MNGPWFVRTVADGDTHRAYAEHWTTDGRAHIRPAYDPATLFAALNRKPIAAPYYDDHRCPDCLVAAQTPIAVRRRRLALVR